jgi:hypothetical protein
MKRTIYILGCAIALNSVAMLSVSAARDPFRLTITAPDKPLKAGAELRLLVTVTNTSSHSISLITSPGPVPEDAFRYEMAVRDEEGRSAPPSAYLRSKDEHVPVYYGSRFARTLKPGESFIDQITVTNFYDLSRPGKYAISVARALEPWQNLGKGTIKSNTVTVTVTQ